MYESNSRDPAFAVVVPTYNREMTIARALDSILSQSVQPAEILVVDDGSDDRTREVVQAYGSVVSLVSQTNRGASAARNVGVHLAKSEWVAFLDSDDYWFFDHLEHLSIAIRDTGGAADVYFANMQRGEPLTTLWEQAGFVCRPPYSFILEGSAWALLPRQPMMLQACAIRRSRLQDVGGFAERLRVREDTHLFLALFLERAVCAVNHVGVVQTQDDASGARLTDAYGVRTDEYWRSTSWLYGDILNRFPKLPRPQISELAARKAASELRLSRLALQRGQRRRSAFMLTRALRTSPLRVADSAVRRLIPRRRSLARQLPR